MTPFLCRFALFSAAACCLTLPFDSARAALTDFSGFTLNQSSGSTPGPTLNAGKTALTLTVQGGAGASSAYGTAPQFVGGGFTASFQYQVTNTNSGAPGDGFVFALQSKANTAVGDAGGSLGYASGTTPVTPSVGLAFDLYSNTANKVALSTGGVIGTYNPIGLTINGGDLIQMNINYVASTTALTLTVKDLTSNSATQTFNFTTNVATDLTGTGDTLPSGQAYVGFTGASGANTSTQVVSAFTAAPEPGTWAMVAAGAGALLAVRARRRVC